MAIGTKNRKDPKMFFVAGKEWNFSCLNELGGDSGGHARGRGEREGRRETLWWSGLGRALRDKENKKPSPSHASEGVQGQGDL